MPRHYLHHDIKTAVEGMEWVIQTTKQESLYCKTVRALDDVYNTLEIPFTHNQASATHSDEQHDHECNDVVLVMFISIMLTPLLILILSQMPP
jgi:hypothetical protein